METISRNCLLIVFLGISCMSCRGDSLGTTNDVQAQLVEFINTSSKYDFDVFMGLSCYPGSREIKVGNEWVVFVEELDTDNLVSCRVNEDTGKVVSVFDYRGLGTNSVAKLDAATLDRYKKAAEKLVEYRLLKVKLTNEGLLVLHLSVDSNSKLVRCARDESGKEVLDERERERIVKFIKDGRCKKIGDWYWIKNEE